LGAHTLDSTRYYRYGKHRDYDEHGDR
jgi:hypothetical protein